MKWLYSGCLSVLSIIRIKEDLARDAMLRDERWAKRHRLCDDLARKRKDVEMLFAQTFRADADEVKHLRRRLEAAHQEADRLEEELNAVPSPLWGLDIDEEYGKIFLHFFWASGCFLLATIIGWHPCKTVQLWLDRRRYRHK